MNIERPNFDNAPKEAAGDFFKTMKDLPVLELGQHRRTVQLLRKQAANKDDLTYYRSLEARINLRLRTAYLLAFGEVESAENLYGAARLCRQTKGMSFETEDLEKLEKVLKEKLLVEVPKMKEKLAQKVEARGFNFKKIRMAAAAVLSPLIIFAGIHLAGILNRKTIFEIPPKTVFPVEQVIYQVSEKEAGVEKVFERLDVPEGAVVGIGGPALGGNSLELETKLMSQFSQDYFSLGLGGDNNLRILALHNGDMHNGESYVRLPGKYLEKFGTDSGVTMFFKVNNEKEKKLVMVDKFVIKDNAFTSDPQKIARAAQENGVELQEGDIAFVTCCDYDISTNSYNGRLIIIYRLESNLSQHLAKR